LECRWQEDYSTFAEQEPNNERDIRFICGETLGTSRAIVIKMAWRTAKSCWKGILKDNLCLVALSFMLGYLTVQQEVRKREQWAEILFRQGKNWLTEIGRKTAGSVEHGLEYARSAAEQAAGKRAEYSRRLNPFRQENRRLFFSIL
jgi:hypothetical protein